MATNIQLAIKRAVELCPDAESQIKNYHFNVTISQDYKNELPKTLCDAAKLMRFADGLTVLLAYTVMVISIIGTISCVFSLFVFSSKRFQSLAFAYYRCINASDLCSALLSLPNSIGKLRIDYFRHSWFWSYYSCFVENKLENSFVDWSELLIIWIAAERALCHFPVLYDKINQKKVAFCVIFLLFMIALVSNIPLTASLTVSLDKLTGIYYVTKTVFGLSHEFQIYTKAFDIWYSVRLAMMTLATIISVAIFLRSSTKKRVMAEHMGLESATSATLLNQAKHNRLLCLLQFCDAMPMLISLGMAVILGHLIIQFDYDTFVVLSYSESQSLIRHYYLVIPLSVCKLTFRRAGHALHVFIYCVFLKRFREAAYEKIRIMIHGMRITRNFALLDRVAKNEPRITEQHQDLNSIIKK